MIFRPSFPKAHERVRVSKFIESSFSCVRKPIEKDTSRFLLRARPKTRQGASVVLVTNALQNPSNKKQSPAEWRHEDCRRRTAPWRHQSGSAVSSRSTSARSVSTLRALFPMNEWQTTRWATRGGADDKLAAHYARLGAFLHGRLLWNRSGVGRAWIRGRRTTTFEL